MAMVTVRPRGETRPKHASDPYSTHLRKRAPAQIDPSMFPPGGLEGLDLGDAGDTGIDLVDDVHHQITEAATYAKITAGFAVAAGIFSAVSLWLLVGGKRRR